MKILKWLKNIFKKKQKEPIEKTNTNKSIHQKLDDICRKHHGHLPDEYDDYIG